MAYSKFPLWLWGSDRQCSDRQLDKFKERPVWGPEGTCPSKILSQGKKNPGFRHVPQSHSAKDRASGLQVPVCKQVASPTGNREVRLPGEWQKAVFVQLWLMTPLSNAGQTRVCKYVLGTAKKNGSMLPIVFPSGGIDQ